MIYSNHKSYENHENCERKSQKFGAGCHFDSSKNLGKSIPKLNYGVINDVNIVQQLKGSHLKNII
ncbi:MAG: hypothetical protein A2W80_17785 [Candidatus Riflebacteria bacterium GWC2_50_8]|nr:MAG: hypothetical protein A2W80_17785 [Candidatus Riflebacteria bacterium GWC2_50_8]